MREFPFDRTAAAAAAEEAERREREKVAHVRRTRRAAALRLSVARIHIFAAAVAGMNEDAIRGRRSVRAR